MMGPLFIGCIVPAPCHDGNSPQDNVASVFKGYFNVLFSWQARFGEEYINEADPSVLRFLIASRDEVSSRQLRDDLLSMLVAGHETTGSVLTWTLYLLEQNPTAMAKV